MEKLVVRFKLSGAYIPSNNLLPRQPTIVEVSDDDASATRRKSSMLEFEILEKPMSRISHFLLSAGHVWKCWLYV